MTSRTFKRRLVASAERFGWRPLCSGVNGKGHIELHFERNGKHVHHTIPNSGHTKGCAMRNSEAELKRKLRNA